MFAAGTARNAVRRAAVVLLCLGSTSAWAAVTVDSVGPDGTGTGGENPTSPIQWTHTVSGSDTVLYVGVACGLRTALDPSSAHPSSNETSDFVVTGVTYNGVDATLVAPKVHAESARTGYIELYRIVAPTTGAHTVSVSFTLANPHPMDAVEMGSVSFAGVDQAIPDENFNSASGNSGTPKVMIASAPGNMVLDFAANGDEILASSRTLHWLKNVNRASGGGNAAQSSAAGAASVTMSYTGVADRWAIVGLSIRAAPPPPDGVDGGSSSEPAGRNAQHVASPFGCGCSSASGSPATLAMLLFLGLTVLRRKPTFIDTATR